MRHEPHFVDALAVRHEPTIGRLISISTIEPDPNQPRTNVGDLSELVNSIRSKGVLEPILVRQDETLEAGRYRIISGERRFRAALEAGLLEIPAIEFDVSEQEALEIALIENLQRKDLSPFEEAEGYRALAEIHSFTHQEISQAVGKSRVSVTESLTLLNMPKLVRRAVDALGVQSKSLLIEVMKAESEEEMIRLLELISRQGLNRESLRREVRNSKKPSVSAAKPYIFKFRPPDKRFQLALTFAQGTVEPEDLIRALEEILEGLRRQEDVERKEAAP